jgi:hypothetical protein
LSRISVVFVKFASAEQVGKLSVAVFLEPGRDARRDVTCRDPKSFGGPIAETEQGA